MKYILLCLCFLPVSLLAQECSLKKGQDAITSKTTLTTGFIELNGTTLSIDINSKEIDFFFVLNNQAVKCLDEETEATVNYEGGKLKSQFRNSGSMNCDGIFHIIFKNSAYTNSYLQKMAAKKIVSIQLTGSSPKPFIISLTAAQQQMLLDTISCVVKESKTVL
ncbi:MAG: hypothetical protein ABIQ88_13215 [Chitinophagaceae bacterium]